MTTEVVYKLYNEGSISNEDVISILNLAKKQKDMNDVLSSGLNN